MPKLFLVGITPDHRGLVLSEHARAKRGDMVLEIDDRLLEAIDKANRLRTHDEGHRLESAALPSKRDDTNGDGGPGRLSPREIQQRLRTGETIAAMARSSGTDEAWIRRFATPVLAEQAKVVERARSLTFTKRGVGASAVPLGPSVAANVIDRGVPLTLPELEAGWAAFQHPEGGWRVTFTFPLRGRRQTAEWEIDVATGDLAARNKLAGELGWRESGKKLPQPKPVKAPAPAKRAAEAARAASKPEPVTAGAAGPETATPAAGPADAPEPAAAAAGTAKARVSPDAPAPETVQELPLSETAPVAAPAATAPAAPARKAPAPRRAAAKKPAEPSASARRAAAAITETPGQVVAVAPAKPAGSMPPTDLDVVGVVDDVPDASDDEIILVDRPEASVPSEPDDDGTPTGPISLRERPQPAPLGARPAPAGGPPAL